jgi:predicted RNase H-like nuclease (RuvC/YqgF family)
LIAKIKNTPLPEDKKEALAVLRNYAAEFAALGKVPMKDKDAVYNSYREALDEHYKRLKLEGAEQERVMFQAKLDTLKASPNADKALQRERIDIREKITRIENDIRQLENNLGFFAKSKGADSLRKEVEGKIQASRDRIVELKNKLKQLV